MEKKSRSTRTHKRSRKNSCGWIVALIGAVLLFLGVILIFLIVGSSSAGKSRTAASAVNIEKDIPETDMGDLVYHEPAAENVVMQGGFGYVNNELLVTLNSADSLPALKEYLAGVGGEVVGEIPLTADYQIMLSGTYSREELEALTEQVKSLPYVERSSLNYAFELEDNSSQGSFIEDFDNTYPPKKEPLKIDTNKLFPSSGNKQDGVFYPNDKEWDDWRSTGGNNWNMKAVDAPGAWAYRDQMESVNVGIIEEIFDVYHEDLTFNVMPLGNVSAMGLHKYAGFGWWTKGQSHGTHVAGIIGADFDNNTGICGIAPNTKLYGANYTHNREFYYKQKAALFYLVYDKKCRVINLSYCLGAPELMYSASKENKKAQEFWGILNEDLANFLRKLDEITGNSFLICKSANNYNDDLFFRKDDEDIKDGNEYIAYENYQKNPNTDEYRKYKGEITKKGWVSGEADAKWDIYNGIEDEEIEDMIIVVGAVRNAGAHSMTRCNHVGYEVAEYSSRGSRVDVLAPGGDADSGMYADAGIYSTVADGIIGYGYKIGTSMAAPHVAGVAAMIFGIDPTFTAKEVKDIITSTATGSYETGFENQKHSCGLLNAKLAVEKAIELRDKKEKEQAENASSDELTGKHRYKIFYDTLTWEEARAACEAKGGHLATITSEKEQYLLELSNDKNQNLWIGGYKNADGQWCWVTGEPWTYENWGDGEPNNSSNVVAGESCVAMWPEKWNDLANGNIYEQSGYICEWEESDSESDAVNDGYTGHVYEFYTLPEPEWESGPITWEQAERRCEWKGGHLAVIESQAENDYLCTAMKQKGFENAYFGYSDSETEGDWKWVNGAQSSYINWHSGEPNNQNGDEDYAMFYQKFDDGTWNDGDGLIDADCAYICEWDDPADKQSSGDIFTERQLKIIAKDLGVPEDLDVQIKQYPKTYWEAAGLWDIYVEVCFGGKVIAAGSFDVETGEMGRNLYIYSH